jgi:L-fuculose-phosphate aldolase
MSESLRRELIDAALAMNAAGINQGTSGNLSVRHGDGMLITPSGVRYEALTPGGIVRVSAEGRPEGRFRPSSEWRIHHDIYRKRPEAQAVLHAHPAHCAALACLRRQIPAFHYMVAVAGGRDIRCADYATFGSQELSEHVLAALEGRKACLMANHGLICISETPEKALSLAIEIENLAKTYMNALSVGEPTLLDDEEMDRVLEKFESYGEENVS